MIAPSVTCRSITRWRVRILAPCAVAPRAKDQHVFHASIEASGTLKTRETFGFSRGSRRSASATLISSAGSFAFAHPSTNCSGYAGSSSGVETNRPPVSSMQSGMISRSAAFSTTHSSAASGSLTT